MWKLLLIILVLSVWEIVNAQPVRLFSHHKMDHSIEFRFKKELHGRFYVDLKFLTIKNSLTNQLARVITSKQGILGQLKPMDRNKWIEFTFRFQTIRGTPISRFKNDFVYLMPFKNGTKIRVQNLGYYGKNIGGGKPDSWMAFQFKTDKSESVLAARKGLVVEVTDEFSADTSQNHSFIRSVNEVLIEHRDGTLARYFGFERGSIKVKPGQYIYPHEELGKTGRYDSEKAYQLHFCIYFLNTREIYHLNSEEKKMNAYSYFTPCFHWKGGESILLPGNDYVAESSEELIMQEFSRREKKKYLKGELN